MSKLSKNFYKGLLVALVVLLFLFLPAISGLYAEIAWYKSVGFSSVFFTPFITRLVAGTAGFILVAGGLWLNFWAFNKLSQGKLYVSSAQGENIIQQPREVGGIAKKVFALASVFIGVLSGLTVAGNWEVILKFLHQTPFNTSDPIFGHDLAYYVFTLPFLEMVAGTLAFLLILSFIISVALHTWHLMFHHLGQKIKFLGSISVPFIPEITKRHLSALVILGFLLTSFYLYAISLPRLLLKSHDLLQGANYTDLHAHLPVIYILLGISILAVLAGIYMLIRGKYGLWVPILALYFGVLIIGGGLYPSLLQSFVVSPNELTKEYTNLERHISATRQAWGLEDVETKSLSGAQTLTAEDIEENRATIDNIRLWDRGPLLDTFSQLQEIRTYYNFSSLDADRYYLNGKYQQLSLAPRELDYDNLPKRNFINERLTYTHGMGAAITPINKVSEEGLPVLYVKDLPPTSTEENLNIDQPAIYYGEKQNDYVITNTESKEFHYPGRDGNVYKDYTGDGGVALNSLWSRVLMALNFSSYRILFNSDITDESKILYNRNIEQRVKKALPFLEIDSDPYMVVAKGDLKWIADAYTVTDHYPYSAETEGVNYMRNSVKVVVDVYDGDIDAYVMDKEDPLIRTYASIFPEIFLSGEEMPDALREHIRYPEDLFSRQTILYSEFHMDDPQNFYNKEDLWNFPSIMGTTRGEGVGPVMRRLIMKLPGKEKEEFVLMLPYTPEGKNNMISWLAARSDGENYGELINYRFPKDSLAYGPQQIIARINQRTEISQQISLWDQRGSEVVQGNLYVVPIEESILYVRPLYLRGQDSRMPELKRVIVAHKESIAMEPTLEGALNSIFGIRKGEEEQDQEEEAEIPLELQPEIKQLAEEAEGLFDDAVRAQQQGNWSEYGELLQELRNKLNDLRSRTEE